MKDTELQDSLMHKGACLIANDASGKGEAAERLELLRGWLERQPGRTALEIVHRGENLSEVARRAVDDGYGTVIVAGGDGTISTVAGVLAGTGVRMGVIPAGTFNYFARGLGIPEDIEGALDVIETGVARPAQIGRINDKVFLNNASLGAYPAILDQREGIYRRWGRSRIAAHWSTVKALLTATRPQRMKVTVDGEVRRIKTPLVFIANSAYQLDEFELEGADSIRNGEFALFMAEDCGRWKMLLFAVKLAWRRMGAGRDMTLICGREIRIESAKSHLLIARDGEKERMKTPFVFKVEDDVLDVIVPGEGRPAA